MIRLGVCGGIDRLATAIELGFDFMEFSLAALNKMTDAEYEDVAAKIAASPIKVEACNGMLPGGLRVTGPDVDEGAMREYLNKNFARASRLGVQVVVFGSGAARNVPEGFPHEEAWRQIADYLKLAAGYAREYGLRIAIEPLRAQECNIMNFVSEGTLMSALVGDENVGVLADTHHMICGHEPLAAIRYAGSRLLHVHISHSMGDAGRDYPFEGDGEDHRALFETLEAAGYAGRVSIEAGCKDFAEDGARALAMMRALA